MDLSARWASLEPTLVAFALKVAGALLIYIVSRWLIGVGTTSFAALIAALGIAIGAAWGGLLSNRAAGAFILVLRPFKVGDYVLAGGVEGTVGANRQRRRQPGPGRRDPRVHRARPEKKKPRFRGALVACLLVEEF